MSARGEYTDSYVDEEKIYRRRHICQIAVIVCKVVVIRVHAVIEIRQNIGKHAKNDEHMLSNSATVLTHSLYP